MSASRLTAFLAALALLTPASAFAQGAGDDQYDDPFGGQQPTQTQPSDGLSEQPPSTGGGSGSSGSGSSGSGSAGATGETPAPTTPAPSATAADGSQLPRTGAEPAWLAFCGLAFLLIGAGLRLRTIDPDAY